MKKKNNFPSREKFFQEECIYGFKVIPDISTSRRIYFFLRMCSIFFCFLLSSSICSTNLFSIFLCMWSLSVTTSFLLILVLRIYFLLLLRCMCSLCFYCNFFSSFFLCVRRTMNANLQTNTSAGPQKCTQIKIHSF